VRGCCNGMSFEGEGFIDVNTEVFDASAWLYILIIYCKWWVVGEFFCLISTVVR
jgi:hypothetical protein